MDEDFDLLGLSHNQSPTHIPGGYRHNAYDPWEGWSGTPISDSEAADRDVELRNVFGFEDVNNTKPTKKHRPLGGLNAQALKNIHDTIWDLNQTNNTVASGGDSGGDNKNLISTINNQEKPTSLYGGGRFNKLWKLYNKVKDNPGVENDPRYHKLIKKISRKMPRTLRNLKTKMDKSTEMRQKISDELGNNITVTSSQENYNAAIARGNQFLKDPFHKDKTYKKKEKNSSDSDIGKEQANQKYSAGKNLGSRLGTNISAALKNKKW